MEKSNTFPLNDSNQDIRDQIINLENRLVNEILTDGEKASIIRKIQIGQIQITNNNINKLLNNAELQANTLDKTLDNNKISSRLSQKLSYVMIVIAIFTMILSTTTIIIGNKTTKVYTKSVDSIKTRLDTANVFLQTIQTNTNNKIVFSSSKALLYDIDSTLLSISNSYKTHLTKIKNNESKE